VEILSQKQIGVDKVMELNNRKAGAVSELLFYANVMRDPLGGAPLSRSSRICGVLLAKTFTR
jgi:hypothetical protein